MVVGNTTRGFRIRILIRIPIPIPIRTRNNIHLRVSRPVSPPTSAWARVPMASVLPFLYLPIVLLIRVILVRLPILYPIRPMRIIIKMPLVTLSSISRLRVTLLGVGLPVSTLLLGLFILVFELGLSTLLLGLLILVFRLGLSTPVLRLRLRRLLRESTKLFLKLFLELPGLPSQSKVPFRLPIPIPLPTSMCTLPRLLLRPPMLLTHVLCLWVLSRAASTPLLHPRRPLALALTVMLDLRPAVGVLRRGRITKTRLAIIVIMSIDTRRFSGETLTT